MPDWSTDCELAWADCQILDWSVDCDLACAGC